MSAKNKPNEIYISRIYDAPVKAVWDAWVDPAQVAQWWGPRGFTLTSHSKGIRVGGIWHYTMHGPDGVDYSNKTKYLEVEKHSRLVYDHGGYDDRPPLFRVTVDFTEVKGRTKMEMTMALATAEAAAETKKFIKKAGGNDTWDRLAEFLGQNENRKNLFVINRTFKAPIDLMYEVWTDPKHFAKWLPPTGFTMEFIRAEVRPNGTSFYRMTNGEFTMYGKLKYLEFSKPNRIVYSQEFADEKGNMARHPGAPLWPESMLTRVELTAESPEETRVTITWEPDAKATREEIDAFIAARSGMTEGWTGSFDKLERYLDEKPA